jgi:hypothetical protein
MRCLCDAFFGIQPFEVEEMHRQIAAVLVLAGLITAGTGCKKEIDKAEFKSAINNSFAGRHVCIWPEPIKLPAEADTSKDEKTRDYDALTDAGLLVRGNAEKKRFLVGSKQVNNYDLSDKGHAAWTADPNQPGYGNFCFGHFNVTAVDSAIPNDASNPTQYTVNYRYEVEGIPGWATTPESMRTFPKIAAATSIQTATATVVKGTNGGWAVVPPSQAAQ